MQTDNKTQQKNTYVEKLYNETLDNILHTLKNGYSLERIVLDVKDRIAFNIGLTNARALNTKEFDMCMFNLANQNYSFDEWLSYYRGLLTYAEQTSSELSLTTQQTPTDKEHLVILFASAIGCIEAENYNLHKPEGNTIFNIFSFVPQITECVNSKVPPQYAKEYNNYREVFFNYNTKPKD